MNDRRVVITGIGVLSPLGNDLQTTWDGLKEGGLLGRFSLYGELVEHDDISCCGENFLGYLNQWYIT